METDITSTINAINPKSVADAKLAANTLASVIKAAEQKVAAIALDWGLSDYGDGWESSTEWYDSGCSDTDWYDSGCY